jgi:hypothetical protein
MTSLDTGLHAARASARLLLADPEEYPCLLANLSAAQHAYLLTRFAQTS